MKPFAKLLICHIAFFAAGIVMVGALGSLILTDNAFTSVYASSGQVISENEQAAQIKSAANTKTVEYIKFMQFRKADISEYDMSFVKREKSSKKDKEDEQENLGEAQPFKVEYPKDNTTVYESPKQPALGLTDTRDISSEYYTVYDEISARVVTLNGHELVCQMVNSEIGDSWGTEAIKAQAVAAYTYVRFNDASGLRPSVGLKSGYSAKLENCVKAVEGQAIYYNSGIINAVYSASTAGYSTTSRDIWGVDYPYLRCVKNEYDSEDPHWGVSKTLSAERVKEIIESKTDIELSGDVKNWFKIESVHSGKYIGKVSIDGHSECVYDGDSVNINGITLCNLFSVKSNAMEISYKDGQFTFTSYGWGHGVGMSQWGACLYARHGWTYDQILRHYYLSTTIKVSSVNSRAVKRGEAVQAQAEDDSLAEENEDSSLSGEDSKAEENVSTQTTGQTGETVTEDVKEESSAAVTESIQTQTESSIQTTSPQDDSSSEEFVQTQPPETEQDVQTQTSLEQENFEELV